jgi:hypothetical protein
MNTVPTLHRSDPLTRPRPIHVHASHEITLDAGVDDAGPLGPIAGFKPGGGARPGANPCLRRTSGANP